MSIANLRVLIVEDSPDDFETLAELAADTAAAPGLARRMVLEQAIDAESAARALSSLAEGDAGANYAYVVLDLNLPGMSGLEFLRWARAQAALRSLPIIVFSTTMSDRERRNCFEAGANAFHVKPTSYAHFRQAANELFGYWGSQATQLSTRSPREESW